MRKVIRIMHAYNRWWWVNRTDNNPPASGKEFDTREQAVKDAYSRVGDCAIEDERYLNGFSREYS